MIKDILFKLLALCYSALTYFSLKISKLKDSDINDLRKSMHHEKN